MTIEQIQQNINEVEQNLHAHNYAEAEVQAQSLLNEAMIVENSELQAQLLYIIGDSLLRRGLSKDALPYFEKTARIAENNAIKSLQLKVFGSLGIVYETLADFAQCMEYYEKALENLNLALKLGGFYNGDYDKIEALKDLSKAYSKLKKYQQALKTYNTLIDLAKEKYHAHLDTNLVELFEGRIETNKRLGYFDAIYADKLQIEKIKENERYQDYNMPPSPSTGI